MTDLKCPVCGEAEDNPLHRYCSGHIPKCKHDDGSGKWRCFDLPKAAKGCLACHAEQQADTIRLLKRRGDSLAYACGVAVQMRLLGERSAIADALLDYLDIGGLDGPLTVAEWLTEHEGARG